MSLDISKIKMNFWIILIFLFICFQLMLADTTPCNAQIDCASDECCISKDRPIGKRHLYKATGYCLQLGSQNSSCFVNYGSATQPPDHLVFGCPCRSPLKCKGTGKYDIPLGEIGLCSP